MNPRWMRWKRVFASTAVLLCAGGAYWIFHTLQQATAGLNVATDQVRSDSQFPSRRIKLDRPVAGGFESITSPAQFSDAVRFQGKLYLCGPTGLLAFDLDGKAVGEYHVGKELPAAPLVRMAVGVGASGLGPQLWIATHGAGLLVYDGRTFEQVRADSAAARALTSVLPLASGRILVGAEKAGVLVWDGHALQPFDASLGGLHVSALAGSETDLWVGTIDQGLVHWHAGQLDRFTEANGLPDARVLSLTAAAEGTSLYAGTPLGVVEFRDGRVSRTLGQGLFASSLLLRNGSLVVGTLEEGVVEISLKARPPKPRVPMATSELPPVQRLLDLDGRLFVLAEDGLYENGKRLFEIPGSLLTDRNISALSLDRAGRLWVGYFDRGVDVLNASFQKKTHYQDDHLFCINRITHEHDRGITAVATANGLVLFDSSAQPQRVLTKADGLIANNVTDVLLRPDGRDVSMTIATPAGLTMFDSKGASSLYAFHGLVNNHVYALASSSTKLLAGTLGGLSLLDSGAVRGNYTTANSGLRQNWITAIQAVGEEWFIGTYGAGVMKLDAAGRWSTFPDLRGSLEVNPNAMLATASAVYAGTLGQGLAVYSRLSGRWTLQTNGLPSENVTALAAAGGYIYVGTENGLVRIPEQQVPIE